MFLEELDTLTVQCRQLNYNTSPASPPITTTTTTTKSNIHPNPKKIKKRNKKKKAAAVAAALAAATQANKENQRQLQRTTPPAARGGATLTLLPEQRQLLVLGGADRTGNEYGFRKIFLFNLNDNGWSQNSQECTTTGDCPGPRSGHVATLVQNKWVYVLGGLHFTSETCFHELYRLNVQTMEWTKFKNATLIRNGGTMPTPRNGLTACPVVNKVDGSTSIYYFGGSSPNAGLMNDLFVLEVPLCDDSEMASSSSSAPFFRPNFNEISVQGTPPTPRESHTCVASNGSLYVYGGRSEHCVNSDIIRFDTRTNQWFASKVREILAYFARYYYLPFGPFLTH